MGCRNREFLSEEDSTRPSSLSQALLFATMCLIGLPVDVHVKDGSVYSGIFHTASGEKDYGIVLKKARMTKKGKCDANVAKEGIIETLVILSCDLVQVVAKGVLFPSDGVLGNMAGDDMEAIDTSVPYSEISMSEPERSTLKLMESVDVTHERSISPTENGFLPVSSSMIVDNKHKRRQPKTLQIGKYMEDENGKINETNLANMKIGEVSRSLTSERQVGDDKLVTQNDVYKHKFKSSEVNNTSNVGEDDATYVVTTSIPIVESLENGHVDAISKFPVNGACNRNLSAPAKPSIHSRETTLAGSTSTDTVSINVPSSNQAANGGPNSSQESPAKFDSGNIKSNMVRKEFKLNPGAKVFSPSLGNPVSATHSIPAVANIAYVPNSSHVMTVPAVQQEVGFSPYQPHLTAKFSQYGSITAVNGGSASQFSNHVIGHLGHGAQAVRYTGNYNPVLADPTYWHPTSPAVMAGRLGQLVYVHPVPSDLIQGAAAIAPASARPLLTPNHVRIPKQHGLAGQAMQYCVPQAALTSGLQPFPMPSHVPVLQPPFPPGRPIPVPGSNGFYGTKF